MNSPKEVFIYLEIAEQWISSPQEFYILTGDMLINRMAEVQNFIIDLGSLAFPEIFSDKYF